MSLHVALDCGIGGEPPQRGIGLHQRDEVVVVQLIAPVRVIAVLEMKSLGEGRRQRDLTAVSAHGAAQGADWIVVSAPGCVVPPFNGGGRELGVASACGVRPGLGSEGADRCFERAGAGGELKSEPTTENRNRAHRAPVELGGVWVITPPDRWGERTVTIRFHRPRSVGEEHLLRIGGDHCETLICGSSAESVG